MSRNADQIFHGLVAGLALAVAITGPVPAQSAGASTAPPAFARVVVVHDPRAMRTYSPDPNRVRAMVDRALIRLTDQADVRAAWRSLMSTGEVVGIKVEASLGPTFGTRPAVVEALIQGLLTAGWPASNIVVWDRHLRDLERSGFASLAERYGIRLAGTAEAGYDPEVFYESPLLGTLLWGDLEYGQHQPGAGRKSHVSTLLTRQVTRIVLVTPLVAHPEAGVLGQLYSLARASVDNFLRFEGELDRLARAVPEICALPVLGDRIVLGVVDALLCQYLGGNRGLLHYSSELNEIRMSRDPVALDVLSLRELERQRRILGIAHPPVRRDLQDNAALLELGHSDPSRLEVITLHD